MRSLVGLAALFGGELDPEGGRTRKPNLERIDLPTGGHLNLLLAQNRQGSDHQMLGQEAQVESNQIISLSIRSYRRKGKKWTTCVTTHYRHTDFHISTAPTNHAIAYPEYG